jgi:hypothetical protein
MKKSILIFGTAFATFGAMLTLIVMLTVTSDFGWDPHGQAAAWRFALGLTMEGIAGRVGSLLGMPESAGRWLWVLLGVATNAMICFLLGAIVGLLARLTFRRVPTPHENGV